MTPQLQQAYDRMKRAEKALMGARATMKGLNEAKAAFKAARDAYNAMRSAPAKK